MNAPRPEGPGPGWDEDHIQRVFAHYEAQAETAPPDAEEMAEAAVDEMVDELAARLGSADPGDDQVVMQVPAELVPEVEALIARYRRRPR